ncbi:sensor histidine kinase [Fulvivirga sedimenti]|uniref:histidine kinase n=1 Tax=Fulvivirga sedimenti TaxID=2879465 RepID=A0A9X1HL08_9BACT|nr:ATP-binding protein [Fulvivirga sedimenti]MCA6073950.1 ATP-binding protein [Fulvivirga sedimenti]
MTFNSRGIAFLLAICVAAVTTAFLSLFEEVTRNALVVTFFVSLGATYLLVFIVLEFLIFREMNNIYDLLQKLRSDQPINLENMDSNPLNPFRKIKEDIHQFVQLKEKEIDELKKMEAFRKEFIADVSHELKTPIFAAQGFVHTLLDGAVKDKSVRTRFLKKAAKSLDGLDLLVQDLLTLSQIETGEIKMHFEDFDIRRLTEEVFDQFENKAEKKKLDMSFEPGIPDEVIVHGDWKRINQVMTNLISNAVKYSGEKSKVRVNFIPEGEFVEIVVSDTGEGIPEKDVKRIFERFYRVDKSRSREKGGTGLGLAIVKHIMEGHNTKVDVRSTVGKGSEFRFKLKAGEEHHALDEV